MPTKLASIILESLKFLLDTQLDWRNVYYIAIVSGTEWTKGA